MKKANRKSEAKTAGKENNLIDKETSSLHFNVCNEDVPFDLIMNILGFLDNSIKTNLQLQLVSKRWYLTAIDSNQEIWQSFCFKAHHHLPKQLAFERFSQLKRARFFLGYIPENYEGSALLYSPMPSKDNKLEYVCFESDPDDCVLGAEEPLKKIITNITNAQQNLQQLCLCGLSNLNLDCLQFQGLISIFISECSVEDEVLIKISQNSPCLKDLILFQTDTSDEDDNYIGNYSNIGVRAILQNCTGLECLELGGGGDWYDESILDKGMFLNMSCYNLKRVCLGNLQMIDDAAVILLCDSIERLEEFVIDRGDERCLTTIHSMDYLIKKFSGSLSLFIDQSHYYSAIEIENFAVVLDHIIEIQLRFDHSNEYLDSTRALLESRFKSLCNSKQLQIIKVEIFPLIKEEEYVRFREYSHLSWWDSMERKVIPTKCKINWNYKHKFDYYKEKINNDDDNDDDDGDDDDGDDDDNDNDDNDDNDDSDDDDGYSDYSVLDELLDIHAQLE
jgi:hypothetical protein